MASWIIPALKAILPHVKTIYDAAAPVFTRKKAETLPDPIPLLQQQVSELQAVAAQSSARVKELAAQLQSTVTALQEAAAFSVSALLIALVAVLR